MILWMPWLVMRRICLVLALFVCLGHGRRQRHVLLKAGHTTGASHAVPAANNSDDMMATEGRFRPFEALAQFFFALNPAPAIASFAAAGWHFSARPSQIGYDSVVSDMWRRVSRTPFMMSEQKAAEAERLDEQTHKGKSAHARHRREQDSSTPDSLTPVELNYWIALQGVISSSSFEDFMAFVRERQGDSITINLWPVLPRMYVLMGKEANRRVLQKLDPSLEQILQELINFLPIDSRVPSEVDYDLQKEVRLLFSNSNVVNRRLPSFKNIADQMCTRWVQEGDSQQPLNIFFELSEYVLRADLEVLYGSRFTERYAPQLISRFAEWVENIANGQIVGFFDDLGKLLRVEVANMQSNPEMYLEERSVLRVYVESGVLERLDEDSAVGLLTMTLMAAVFNTQVSLAWLLVHLYADPELLARAREEIESCSDLNDYEAISQLRFLNACVDEAVRLHTMLPGNLVLRKALRDVQLGEQTVEQGSLIYLYPNAVHRDENFFPQSSSFCPMRLLNGKQKRMDTEFELVTFGHGKNRCLGEKMARAQIIAFLAQVLPHVDAEAPETLPADGFFDLIPAAELRLLNLRRRHSGRESSEVAS